MRKDLLAIICCYNLWAGNVQAASVNEVNASHKEIKGETNPYSEITVTPSMKQGISTDKIVYKDKKTGQLITIYLDRYDPKVYALAYKVFIMSGEPLFAFKVARIAVRYEPRNVKWRERLAQAALWSGNAIIALRQWLYFINNHINPGLYIPKALKLATQLFDYDVQVKLLLMMLKTDPENQVLFLKYNTAIQNQGFPKKALSILKKKKDFLQNSKLIEEAIKISKALDQPEQELKYIKRLNAIRPADVKTNLEQAKILYSKGNLKGAFKRLQIASAKAKDSDKNFWLQYAEIARLTGHPNASVKAFSKLYEAEAIQKEQLQTLVSLEVMLNKNKAAYSHARTGFEKTGDLNFFKTLLGTEQQTQEVDRYLKTLSPNQMASLRASPDYATRIAIIKWQVGDKIKGWQEWQSIINRWPRRIAVQRDLLWFLVDNHLGQQLAYVLKHWCNIFQKTFDLRYVYVSILMQNGEYKQALDVMKRYWKEINNDYVMLLNVADLFAQNNNVYATYYTQRRAFYLVLNQLLKRKETDLELQLAFSELMRRFAPAEMTYRTILSLTPKLFKDSSVDEQITAWALEQRNYSLARHIIRRRRYLGMHTPSWMELTLALEEDDRERMQSLLKNSPKTLPYRDRVTAAEKVGDLKLAEEYAYQGLKDHPKDAEMYRLFTDLMLPRANKILVEAAFKGYGLVIGPLTRMEGRYFITPSLAMIPYSKIWYPHSTDLNVIASPPTIVQQSGLRFKKWVHSGWLEGSIASMKGLKSVLTLKGKWQYENVYPRLNTRLGLDYHDEADQTSALLIGGMQNDISINIDYAPDTHHLFDAEAKFIQFYGQDGSKLGTGQEVRAHLQHKFYLTPPDWNLNLYGSWLNYQNNNQPITPTLQRLIPPTDVPTVDFYMPIDNLEGGITFGFNQRFREEYTKDWKLFAEGGFLYSNAFGFGKIINGGAATSIFGRDHLVLFGEYSVNQQQVNQVLINQAQAAQVFYYIGIIYEYYF